MRFFSSPSEELDPATPLRSRSLRLTLSAVWRARQQSGRRDFDLLDRNALNPQVANGLGPKLVNVDLPILKRAVAVRVAFFSHIIRIRRYPSLYIGQHAKSPFEIS